VTAKFSYTSTFIVVAFSLLFVACNPTKRLHDGEFLVEKNVIIDKDIKPNIDNSEIENYIKQKPNRRIFVLFSFHLWLYNLANEDKIRQKRAKYNIKHENKNIKRIAKGKKPKANDKQLVGEWLLETGEPPVKLDTVLTEKSTKQIKLLLNNKGYFISTVSDSVVYKRRKKAVVFYKINADAPYTFNKVDYKIPDSLVKQFVLADTLNSLLVKGNNYDVDVLQKERDRITNALNNKGYYLFTKDYIFYEIDTTIGNKKVNVTLGIKNFVRKITDLSDTLVESQHQQFYINNIYIQPDFVSKKNDLLPKDTILIDNYNILHTDKLKYKTKVLLNTVFIKKGELYQLKNVEDTYKRLSELKAFKTINIYFVEKSNGILDCHIQLSPILKQSFTVETEGTNRSGNAGIAGSIVFQNRNLFKGAEVFELRLKGGLVAQRALDGSANSTTSLQQLNTIELGPELNINIPRFLTPFKVKSATQSNPKTVFTSSFNYQQRRDYTRKILNFSFGYAWRSSPRQNHTFNPIILDYVQLSKQSVEFTDYLDKPQNKFTKISFRSHLTPSTRYSYLFNGQSSKKQQNFSYFKINLESSGSALRGFYNLMNYIKPNTFVSDAQNSYTLLDVAYSQYLRADIDYRYYYSRNDVNKVVFRIAGGIGKPLSNYKVLPFERSFFSGGTNGLRAWQARTLGPGSYADPSAYILNFGDGQLEANIEYRLKLFKIINGAFFIDAGNVWLRKPDPERPDADFQFNRFYKEIAIGSGLGLRLDLSFFIIRLDLGIKVRDPQFFENDRWVIQHLFDGKWKDEYNIAFHKKYNFSTLNFGIGYPF
jgi:outer membrane protein assembly factor BamA